MAKNNIPHSSNQHASTSDNSNDLPPAYSTINETTSLTSKLNPPTQNTNSTTNNQVPTMESSRYSLDDEIARTEDGVPTDMFCPFCQHDITTQVSRRPGMTAGILSAAMCFVCWPLFWVPLVAKSCTDVVHRCPECNAVIASQS